MKAIIRIDRESNKIVGDYDDYEGLKNKGKTDAQIEVAVKTFNACGCNMYAKIIELNEVAEFYKNRSKISYNAILDKFEDIKSTINSVEEEIREHIKHATKILGYKEAEE